MQAHSKGRKILYKKRALTDDLHLIAQLKDMFQSIWALSEQS